MANSVLFVLRFFCWLSVNLHDLADPHIILYTGAEPWKVNLKINRAERARLIAKDPMACAEWFDFYSKQVIATLFGSNDGKSRTRGLFGTCEGYDIYTRFFILFY